jgi:chitinase
LYGDDRLLRDPDQVATNENVAWATAFWFWKVNVGSNALVKRGQFGTSTNLINGALECRGIYKDKARKRFAIYRQVLQAFKVFETPIETGCYN